MKDEQIIQKLMAQNFEAINVLKTHVEILKQMQESQKEIVKILLKLANPVVTIEAPKFY